MIGLMIFSGIAALIVWWAGRKDAALDPQLTTLVLCLLLVFPLLILAMPKVSLLPAIPEIEEIGGFPWLAVLSVLWAGGCVFSLTRLAFTAWKISQWRKHSRWLGAMEGVVLRELPGLRGPVAAGVFRKVIFVPEGWENREVEQREIVMKHELTHHRRHDPLRRWVAELAMAVHWFNPLVSWILRRLMIQCEYACDVAVLRDGIPADRYASLLCDLAEETSFRGPVLAMAEKSGLESRVQRMIHPHHVSGGAFVKCMIAVTLIAALSMAMLGARQSFGFTNEEIKLRRTANPFPGEE